MGYYTRILTPSTKRVSVDVIHQALRAENLSAEIAIEEEEHGSWLQLAVTQPDGTLVTVVEYNEVAPCSLAEEEIAEFLESIEECKPRKAVLWLQEYLARVRAVYAFQHFSGSDQDIGRAILECIRSTIWSEVGGIFQADNEGFSNEEGYHILWQFSERVAGSWNMGILDEAGRWVHFKMDLANPLHRKAFGDGHIPEGCTREDIGSP